MEVYGTTAWGQGLGTQKDTELLSLRDAWSNGIYPTTQKNCFLRVQRVFGLKPKKYTTLGQKDTGSSFGSVIF